MPVCGIFGAGTFHQGLGSDRNEEGAGSFVQTWRPFGHTWRDPEHAATPVPMNILDWSGYAAALCTTSAYIPQVLKVWRTRSTEDISLKTYLALLTGLSLWLTYGFWKGELPLIVANSITLTLAGTILFFKLRESGRANRKAADRGSSRGEPVTGS